MHTPPLIISVPTDPHFWDMELTRWLERSTNIGKELARLYFQFFILAFENTTCPARAWFGIRSVSASIVVGNIYLASVLRSGKDRGIWLLLHDAFFLDGWETWETKSTTGHPQPLWWLHTPFFYKVQDVLDNPDIWASYQIASHRILSFPVASADRDQLQRARQKVRLNTIYTSVKNPLDEVKEYEASFANLPETERQALIQSRIGQGKFRTNLLKYWGAKCAVSGCKNQATLRASHIKPWRHASNAERLDCYNGLLLIPNLDAAFDTGYISFSDDGSILISPLLSEDDRYMLGIHARLSIDRERMHEQHFLYLRYHREHIFQMDVGEAYQPGAIVL